ncbi:hypothetical protein M405DRAFT_930617 [Rhizopogon salebrosus TDB-379]|nr:hypothetical protein M405DRAFT_930617 [Rhizopogon salebrosus TDB-379]
MSWNEHREGAGRSCRRFPYPCNAERLQGAQRSETACFRSFRGVRIATPSYRVAEDATSLELGRIRDGEPHCEKQGRERIWERTFHIFNPANRLLTTANHTQCFPVDKESDHPSHQGCTKKFQVTNKVYCKNVIYRWSGGPKGKDYVLGVSRPFP